MNLIAPRIKGMPPSPRCLASLNFFPALNYLIVYGGKNDS